MNTKNDRYSSRRSLQAVVRSALTRTFHRNESSQTLDTETIDPSGIQTDCSTLVDFPVETIRTLDLADNLEDSDGSDFLDEENCAWMPRKAGLQSRPLAYAAPKQRTLPNARTKYVEEERMIDLEDRAWNSPKISVAKPLAATRKFSMFSRKAPSVSSNTAQLLDPEDRAWM